MSLLIHEQSKPGRRAVAQAPLERKEPSGIPKQFRRRRSAPLPEVSELQVVRHYTRLSRKNFSIDTEFYPLGSCTMKYNPRGANEQAMLAGFVNRHPEAPDGHSQGFMACMYDLQEMLKELTGMQAISLSPAAGAQGEFAGVAMIRAYHDHRGDTERTEILVPDAAHGTNPASAVMCGYKTREIPSGPDGDVDVEALKAVIGPHTAGIMLTNPSTLGVFDRGIVDIAELVHGVGGLLYYDGANLNAILGKVRPGDMGFDVIHLNLHKTFSTPHGGGGPGAGPVGVGERLLPYLPVPMVAKNGEDYQWITESEYPQTIGRLSAFAGNAGVLLRAYVYAGMLGREGMPRVAEYSALNANYMMVKMREAGFEAAYPSRRATHEFIITLRQLLKDSGVNTMDFAKRLLDYGFHAPTTYFPLLVPECLLIEPTETEDKATLDAFIEAMKTIYEEAMKDPGLVKSAPHFLPVKRLDDVRAARVLDLAWKPTQD
ncbi:MAG: glycine dehydrogenase subunit 2 [Gammaproteobacteria bacterium]|nr:glycine dehydrogenase subunit 2 [Gammaproteobacteria bacterium]